MDPLLNPNTDNSKHLQNTRRNRVFWQFLHGTTCDLTFSQEVVREWAAESIPYSQADFHWLFHDLGPLAPNRKPKGWLRAPFGRVPRAGHQHGKELSVKFLLPMPCQAILLTEHGSLTVPYQQGVLHGKGVTKDQSRCGDELVPKESAKAMSHRTVSQEIPQQCLSKRQRSVLKGHSISASAGNLINVRQEDSCRIQDHHKQEQGPKPQHHSQPVVSLPEHGRGPGLSLPLVNKKELRRTPQHPQVQNRLDPCVGSHDPHTENSFQQQLFTAVVPEAVRSWEKVLTPTDCATKLSLRPSDYSGTDTEMPWQQPRHSPAPKLSLLRYAVEEWRNAWKIKTALERITTEGLMRALSDLHSHVRLAAIVTYASRVVNRPWEEQDHAGAVQYRQIQDIQPAPQELQPLLLSALDDPDRRVQMAAAVCQYAMGMANARARDILYSALHHDWAGMGVDSWVAAQCLAVEGDTSLPVIHRLLSQHFGSEEQRDKEQAATLLVNLSSKTTLVRSLLAEQLNCANWRSRVLACNTISQLKGPINKDLVNKLMHLMWRDWCGEARQAAAQALGKLGRSREVHNMLRVKMEEGLSSCRVEALVLLAHLRIMTAKLMPSFLCCLHDNVTAVRKQACMTAATLLLKDEKVVDLLIQLMQDDPVWEVKVAAISALGKIGCLTPTLQEVLLRALQCEEEPNVRIAACKAIIILGVNGPELQQLLQQRLLLENHPQVHRHIQNIAKRYGYNFEVDKGMAHKIKDEVQKLCTKSIIMEKVLLLEQLEDSLQQQRRFLGNGEHHDTSPPAMTKVLQAHYKELNHSPSTTVMSESADDAGIETPCVNP